MVPDTTTHAAAPSTHAGPAYIARPRHQRRGVALCLSGGGYRALLFHLGALTRLNELGVLSSVATISSVSGGSILAAAMADRLDDWPEAGERIEAWSERVVEPMLAFTKRNIRNLPILKRYALPWNWLRSHVAVGELEAAYAKHLTARTLAEIPMRPRYVLSATDMVFGVNWVFDSAGAGRTGDYQAGYLEPMPPWPLARAVAASSCFPPVFDPMPLDLDPSELIGGSYAKTKERDRLVAGIKLSDGGVYDNLGTEPVWKDHATILVSDGGAVFEGESDKGLVWRLNRYAAISGRQGSALRKRWLISNFASEKLTGAYWGVGSVAAHYGGASGYDEALVDGYISEVRTDLDRFTDGEQRVLVNHGYLLADAALRRHCSALITIDAGATVPYPQYLDGAVVKKALKGSAKHRLLNRRG